MTHRLESRLQGKSMTNLGSRLFVTSRTVAHQVLPCMGILQARILEWASMSSSRGSSQPKDQNQVSLIAGRFFTIQATREAHEY